MTTKIYDSRANRNNNMGGYREICNEVVKNVFGEERKFGGCSMTYNNFKTTSYKRDWDDVQIDIDIDFVMGTITITTK